MDLIGIVGTIGTFIFGFLSIFLFLRSRRLKKPVIIYDCSVLQTRAHPEVSILFNKEQIENLSKSHFVFFNKGKKEIRSEDIPNSKYPTIDFTSPTRILSYQILKTSTEEIGIKVKQKSDSALEIIFDYLNHGDGVVLEVLYESPPSTKEIPTKFIAPIKGAEPIVSYKYHKSKRNDLFVGVTYTLLIEYLGVKLIYLGYASKFSWLLLILGCVLIPIGVYSLWELVLKPLHQKEVPDFAAEYFEN